jgi:hypothetical protein
LFETQVKAFCPFTEARISALNPEVDGGLIIALGKCFSVIVYAQLVAENCLAAEVAASMISIIFHGLIEDLTAESLNLSAMFPRGSPERTQLKRIVRVPRTSATDLRFLSEFITARYGT